MWNLYDIEKKYEAHVKELEERSRKAHLHMKEEKTGLRPRAVVRWLSLAVIVVLGYLTLK
ncbi:hypothetical protein A8709_23650 [Paenibacillus pectinilyticus]|uniref:Uncharacterized protein n=1 Tax=Paenibacillus pectinilyticus TaxID=512399 RepID=A0A1C1A8Q9_9BACL|nr:hypothetical protein [Paenibacillus pectinilyticus]OCT16994.1 hypothetical protein A8709_23650 [Paenibacillus pectinilyticus]